ncbi:MAG: NAD(P)-dependent oxidoreductase [Hominenteromicrobium sp.]
MERTIGFIGLGHMGGPMAENMQAKFGNLVVFNRSQTKCRELEQKDARIAHSPAETAQLADVIFLCLPGPKEVEAIVAGENGLLANSRPGQIIVDFSTVAPSTSVKMAEAAAEKSVTYLDIPVSGGGAGAAKGTLSLMIGASEAEVDGLGLLPYLETVGSKFHYIGKRGGGSAIKVINNYMSFTAQVINGEALLMADQLGIPVETFYEVVMSSSGSNMILGAKMNKVKTGDFSPSFTVDLVLKDLELARQLCQDCGIPNFTLNTGIQFYRAAQLSGRGGQDSSSVIDMIRSVGSSAEQ